MTESSAPPPGLEAPRPPRAPAGAPGLAPRRPRLHPLLSTPVLFLALIACGGLAMVVAIPLEPLSQWLRGPGVDMVIDEATGVALPADSDFDIATVILHSLATWLVAIPVLLTLGAWLGRLDRERLGLAGPRQVRAALFLGGLATGTCLIALPTLLALALGGYHIVPVETLATLSAPTGSPAIPGLALLVVGLFIAAFGEELLCRGLILRYWEPVVGPSGTLMLSTLVFTAMHISNEHMGALPIIGLLLAGMLLGAVFLLNGSLWLATGLHLGWNLATALLFGLPVSGFLLPACLRLEAADGPLWDLLLGGSFGPEEGLLYHLVLVVAGIFLVSGVRPAASLAGAPGAVRSHPPNPGRPQ